jgi:hypothetical protein
VKTVKLCWHCRETMKTVLSKLEVFAPSINYCQNIRCERYGLVAAVWVVVTTDDKGLSIESTVHGGIEIFP